MAILWWISTGIHLKMKSDIDFLDVDLLQGEFGKGQRGSSTEVSFWKPHYISNNTPLTIDHLLLSFIMLGICLLLSIIAFSFEQFYFFYNEKKSSAPKQTWT